MRRTDEDIEDELLVLRCQAGDGEALSRREFAVRPSAGTMLLWHSSIYHSVHANLSEDTRISISFNIALAWSDHYLGEE